VLGGRRSVAAKLVVGGTRSGQSMRSMDARSWRRIAKTEVLPRVPELVLTGSVLHTPDTEWLLRAAVKNDSAFSKAFTVEIIVMPLYEPTDHIGWLVGARLGQLTDGHDIWWEPDTQSADAIGADIAAHLRRGALRYWDRLGDLASFAAECRRRPTFDRDVHYVEWVAGAAVILGDNARPSTRTLLGTRGTGSPGRARGSLDSRSTCRIDVAPSASRSHGRRHRPRRSIEHIAADHAPRRSVSRIGRAADARSGQYALRRSLPGPTKI
jgi:hypothetical protein